ncbi:MAG: hypothetical protein ACSLEZ_14270 [Thiobacillus sp.]
MNINPSAGARRVGAAPVPGLSVRQKLTQSDYAAWMTRFLGVSRAYLAHQRTADTVPVLRYRAGEKGSWPSPIFYPFEL